jgi:hypothetical protein
MPMPARMALWLSGMAVSLPLMKDLAGIGLVKAVEDRHQRRFSGAVFADDAVDRARGTAMLMSLFAWTGPKALEMPFSSIA